MPNHPITDVGDSHGRVLVRTRGDRGHGWVNNGRLEKPSSSAAVASGRLG